MPISYLSGKTPFHFHCGKTRLLFHTASTRLSVRRRGRSKGPHGQRLFRPFSRTRDRNARNPIEIPSRLHRKIISSPATRPGFRKRIETRSKSHPNSTERSFRVRQLAPVSENESKPDRNPIQTPPKDHFESGAPPWFPKTNRNPIEIPSRLHRKIISSPATRPGFRKRIETRSKSHPDSTERSFRARRYYILPRKPPQSPRNAHFGRFHGLSSAVVGAILSREDREITLEG